MSALTPCVAILMPPIAGMVADRIGNFKVSSTRKDYKVHSPLVWCDRDSQKSEICEDPLRSTLRAPQEDTKCDKLFNATKAAGGGNASFFGRARERSNISWNLVLSREHACYITDGWLGRFLGCFPNNGFTEWMNRQTSVITDNILTKFQIIFKVDIYEWNEDKALTVHMYGVHNFATLRTRQLFTRDHDLSVKF
jgi:hypothetical protein